MREFDELEALMAKPASPLAEIRRAGCETGWRGWLASCAQHFTYKGFAPHHEEFWDWVWTIEDGVRPSPTAHVNIWSRSHAKSTSAELAVALLCARGKRKYVVYVCRTQDQADAHVANIGGILESQAIADVYPTVGQRLVNDYGHAKGWKRSQLRSAAGFSVEAYGLDSAQRGAKIDQYRPDLIVLDDADDPRDTEVTVQKNIEVLTKGLLPTGSRWMCVMAVQNLISDYGIFGRMVSGEADFLVDRHLSGPIPAIENLETDIRENEEGQNRYVVIGGQPTWTGYTLDDAQNDIDTYGFSAFDVEFQHNTGGIGDMFPPDKWIELDDMPTCRRYVRAWDFAGTDKKRSDWTVGVKMGRLNGRTYIVDVIRRRVLSGDLRELVLATAQRDGKRCRIVIPKDPGQAGIYQAVDFGTGLNGYSVYPEPQTGSKTTKAEAFSGAQQLGMVHVPKAAPWLGTWKYEYNQFGGGSRWDDQVDAGASAFNRLATLGEGNTGFSERNRNQ